MKNFKPTILLILDGWGQGVLDPKINAVFKANTPNLDYLLNNFPWSKLQASGEAVGLPKGQMGNSEVGHLNIGAGRIVYQDIVRIDKSIEEGTFFKNRTLNGLIEKVKQNNSSLHLLGLISDGGVHSHENHIYALLELAKKKNLSRVYVHCFLDGRDTPPTSGANYIKKLQNKIKELGVGTIASIVGRYYAMDRDKRWERTKLAYDMLVLGRGEKVLDPYKAVLADYDRGKTDEFIEPKVVVGEDNKPLGLIKDGDGVFFFNFRADRARQLTLSLFKDDFKEFKREVVPKICEMATMTQYEKDFPLPVAFEPEILKNIMGEVCSNLGLKQLRIAETEKYAHVTYFFNGGREEPFEGEERKLIPSPKEVATYDQKPEMSVYEVTQELEKGWLTRGYDFVVCNFANLDMVGHTGNFDAAVKACEAVDSCVGRVMKMLEKRDGRLFVTADHGNADEMVDKNGEPHTAHSTNPVAFVWYEIDKEIPLLKKEGKLGDIAPTILYSWGVEIPPEMTGDILIISEV